jgi:hypothetical protein
MTTAVEVSEANYRFACDQYQGWCPECGAFTVGSTEPDVDDGECTVCGCERVHGAEQALLVGLIEIVA